MTRRRLTHGAAAILIAVLSVPSSSPGSQHSEGRMLAGAARRDLTWAAGAAPGQVGSRSRQASPDARFDLYQSAKLKEVSEGFQSRTWARALVVQGGNGERVAYVQVDSYLMQDTLHRKVGELLERHDAEAPAAERTGISRDRLVLGSTHNHSAPQASSAAWGVWAFSDAYDVRNFHYMARQIAGAVVDAAEAMRPVRFGATVGRITDVQRNIMGPAVADDGTPAGVPRAYSDAELTILRFDDISNLQNPVPYAILGNFGMHPESLPDGHILLSADFNAMLHPAAERALRATYGGDPMLIWSQGNVGDVEPDQSSQAGAGDFWRRGFAPTETMARRMAKSVVDAVALLDASPPATLAPGKVVPFTTDAPVGVVDMYLPGPVNAANPEESRPVPFANNCRTAETLAEKGQLRVGTVADCSRVGSALGPTPIAGIADIFEDVTGLPFPRNQGALPSRNAMNETYQIHLTVVRIGEVLFGTCPCEAQTDQVVNFKTRADAVTGNLHDGYEWPCSPSPTAADKVVCSYPNPTAPASHIASKARWELALTQVHNDARDPDQPGNFSKVELGAGEIDAALYAGDGSVTGTLSFDGVAGFPVAFMLAQAQDYVGYIVSYREFMARDHYRKTLTSFGPHSSDYINTFLMRGASVLRTGAADPLLGLFARPLPDPQREAEYQAFAGLQGEAAVAGYEAGLPDDSPLAGSPQQQPASKTRFGVARFSWYGGSNATDLPRVVVVDAAGQTVATNDYGEIVTTVAFPTVRTAADWVAAGRPYIWTAHWEIGVDTPPGAYGFVVDGLRRAGGATVAYDLESAAFTVSRWTSGGAIGDPVVQPDRITFTVGSAPYPNEYFAEDANDPRKPRFIDPSNVYRRTFRPRPLAWSAARAFVTVTHADNTISTIEAFLVGGEWVALYAVQPGDLVSVLPSDVVDADGNPAG